MDFTLALKKSKKCDIYAKSTVDEEDIYRCEK